VGCDDRFIRLDGRRADGGHVARPVWEAFFSKALADGKLGLDKKAIFARPDSVGPQYDYQNLIEKTPPPGAEGIDQGNGNANQYLTIDTTSKVRSSQY